MSCEFDRKSRIYQFPGNVERRHETSRRGTDWRWSRSEVNGHACSLGETNLLPRSLNRCILALEKDISSRCVARARTSVYLSCPRIKEDLAARHRRRVITCETRAIRSRYRTTVAPLLRCRPSACAHVSKTMRTALDRAEHCVLPATTTVTRLAGSVISILKRRLFGPDARRRFAAEVANERGEPTRMRIRRTRPTARLSCR